MFSPRFPRVFSGEEVATEGLRQRGAKAPEVATSEAKGEDRCPISGKQGAPPGEHLRGGPGTWENGWNFFMGKLEWKLFHPEIS